MFKELTTEQVSIDDISSFFEIPIQVSVLRLDKIHPLISGNKWFKLRYYIETAKSTQKKGILTFGGAWSNHIVATAAACHLQQLPCTGIIRGEEPADYSPTLLQAAQLGMQLVFISREAYKQKMIPSSVAVEDYLLVNEGGYGPEGARGAMGILDYAKGYTHYCCAAGTGTMMAGLINGLGSTQQVTGISVLKNNTGLEEAVSALLTNTTTPWTALHGYHAGGYAKTNATVLAFMNEFYRKTGIPSDFVYTGKLFYAMHELVRQNYFPAGSRVLLVHSGGLQGNASLPKGTLMW